MDPIKIIQKYYDVDSVAYKLLITHGKAVAKKALKIAKRIPQYNPDLQFIEEAAILHDIWIFLTKAPGISCFGDITYICHGPLGREILEKEWFPKHALVCDRHTGMGISQKDIENQNLPLPKRDMIPISIEEQIICFADKFFTKTEWEKEKSKERIRKESLCFWVDKVQRFDERVKKFWE